MDRGELLILAICVMVLLPAGARIAGRVALARKLGVLPLFAFGLLSLLIALDPHSTFLSGNEWYPEAVTPLSASVGRPVFALSGVLLLGLGSGRSCAANGTGPIRKSDRQRRLR